MKKTKEKDFKTVKKRLGKEQLRKFKSLDEKLLSNLSRVKKTVKLSTQSISIKKDSLNVTSRRLTFPELVGKSRHPSENVRNHAFLGLAEFIRRYEDEGKPNVYILLQVSCSSLFSNSKQLRVSSRNLLLSIFSTYFKDSSGCSKKCSEVVHLFLIQGILVANGSSDTSFSDDVYTLVNLILDRYPWILAEYYKKLLKSLLQNSPESLSFKHFNCVYTLFKLFTNIDHNTRNDLMEYIINVQYKLLTNRNPIINTESNSKINKRSGDKGSSLRINNEIECLSRSSMVVKSFKILFSVSDCIPVNDSRVVDLLLSVDLFESENITDKGKETFEKLFSEFVMIKAQISLKLLPVFTRYHLALFVPLLQLENLKNQVESSKLVQILFVAISLKFDHSVNLQVKLEWVEKILNILSDSKLDNISVFKNYLQNLKESKNQFKLFNRFEEISSRSEEHNKNKDRGDDLEPEDLSEQDDEDNKSNRFNRYYEIDDLSNQSIREMANGTGGSGNNTIGYNKESKEKEKGNKGDLKEKLFGLYNEILNSLFNSVIESPSVWPLLALLRGVPPQLFSEIFNKSHYWSYLSKPKSNLFNGTGGSGNNTTGYSRDSKEKEDRNTTNNNLFFDSVFKLGYEFKNNWKLNYNFEEVMNRFIDSVNSGLLETLLKLCLYLSRKDSNYEFYYKLSRIDGLKQEHWLIISRIYLNIPSSGKINDYLKELVLDLYCKGELLVVKELLNVLLFHLLNFKCSGKLDEQGRVVIDFDVSREVLKHFENFMKFYMNLVDKDTRSNNTTGYSKDNKEKDKELSITSKQDKEEREERELLNYTLKLLIDKYLMAMCRIESDVDLKNTIQYFIEESLHPQFERISVSNRSKSFKVLKEVLSEYMDKDSIPDWISIECK